MLTGPSLQLRALEQKDLPFLHKLHNSYRDMSFFFEEPYETLRELEDLFEKHLHNLEERRFIVQERTSLEPVGVLSLIEIDEINRKAELDIIINDEARGKGYGHEAFGLALKYGFDVLNLYKIYLLVLPDNLKGRKIYTSYNFREEARLIREYFVNGSYVDVLRMCLFADEWRQIGAESKFTTRSQELSEAGHARAFAN